MKTFLDKGYLIQLLSCLLFIGILPARGQVILHKAFVIPSPAKAPDYAENRFWAALPTKTDKADQLPLGSHYSNGQATALADVFFIHPTTYTQEPTSDYPWNASLEDSTLNLLTDQSTILNQASVFNGSCRVYAPRYRQAHYYAFITTNATDKSQALDFAYADVRAAFEYYLKNYNEGRPIVIAAHSQGTIHAVRLLRDFFDEKPLGKKLVVAYLIGMPVLPDAFVSIPPGTSPTQTCCFVSWRTFAKGYIPEWYQNESNTAVCTNPLSWSMDEGYISQKNNVGGVGLKYTFYPQLADAQVHGGLLWINKPYLRGRMFLTVQNWHNADINLFWGNIRQNVQQRLDAFLKKE